ncbi:MAG: DUF4199 family protein [Spirosomataceae bacterium]
MTKSKIIKYSLIFGGLTALACVLVSLIQFYGLGKSPFGKYKVPALGVNLIFIFFAVWYYRRDNGGYLSFSAGFSVGFLTNLIGSILAGLLFYVFVLVDKRPLALWQKENIENAQKIYNQEKDLKRKEDYKTLIENSKLEIKPSYVFLDEIVKKQYVIIGIALIGMVLRRRNPAE